MKSLELTLPTAAENVALDEALLLQAENGELPGGLLRIWESPSYAVVMGRASKIDEEVNRELCAAERIAIIRRSSGGASILAGPGCLMYAVILPVADFPAAASISATHELVLGRMVTGLKAAGLGVQTAGTSDLVFIDSDDSQRLTKFSGNSLRKSRKTVLYHGTLLYQFDIELLSQTLRTPPRTPEYRAGRIHCEFVGNLPVRRQALVDAIKSAWDVMDSAKNWPRLATDKLVREKYGRSEWNERR